MEFTRTSRNWNDTIALADLLFLLFVGVLYIGHRRFMDNHQLFVLEFFVLLRFDDGLNGVLNSTFGFGFNRFVSEFERGWGIRRKSEIKGKSIITLSKGCVEGHGDVFEVDDFLIILLSFMVSMSIIVMPDIGPLGFLIAFDSYNQFFGIYLASWIDSDIYLSKDLVARVVKLPIGLDINVPPRLLGT